MSKFITENTVLLEKKQVCEMLGISATKFYELISEGLLPAKKLKNSTRILATDLDKFIKNLPDFPIEPAIKKRLESQALA